MSESTIPSESWPKNPRVRERSLSRVASLLPYNQVEYFTNKVTFLDHLDDSEKKFDKELVADIKRWNQEIADSESALNDLATPKQWHSCSRGNEPDKWIYKGQLHTTEQDLRGEWPPLPPHQYRHFKFDHEPIHPMGWEKTHQRSTLVGNILYPLSNLYHARSHDKENPIEREQLLIDKKKNEIDNQYVANAPRFVFGHYPTTTKSEKKLPFELNPKQSNEKLNLWPQKPKIYPNYLEPPPSWRTCENNAITHYLPSSKLKGQELFDAWARFNRNEKINIMWNPNFLEDNNKYFPVVLDTNVGSNWIGGYNRGPRTDKCPWPWLSIAMMNFLPSNVNTVIAGNKGLIALDGGEYLSLTNQDFSSAEWPSQSITMVVNPLVQTFQIIPPLDDPKYAQKFKIGRLHVEELPGRSKSYYKLYMVGERSGTFIEGDETSSYKGSLVTIYDSRSHIISDINTFDVQPSPLGVSSLVVIHGHMIWGGIRLVGQKKKVTEVKSKRYQPPMGSLAFENGVVSYDLLHKKFQFQSFALHPKIGDLGDDEKWESPRILCAYGVVYLVTRQIRYAKGFKMPTQFDSTFYVFPPQVFRVYNNANPVHVHPLPTMPSSVKNWLFGPKQEDYNKCRFDVRGGMGDLCFFAYSTMNFAICTPEIDKWRILESTLDTLPSLPTLLRLADCEFTPNFRAEPKHQPGEHHLSWEGQGKSYPMLLRPRGETLVPNEDYRVQCCNDDPIPYEGGSNIMGLGPLLLEKPPPSTAHLRRRTNVPLARNSIAAATRASYRKLSYAPPVVPPDWLAKEGGELMGPPHPPMRPIKEFED